MGRTPRLRRGFCYHQGMESVVCPGCQALERRLSELLAEVERLRQRAEEAKRLKRDGYEPVLKRSRWCFLKRPANLTEKQTVKLKELLRYNLKPVRA